MTAPAAAPASGPIAPAAPRAAPQPPADRFAFAAVLDSLPSATAKAGASVVDEHSHPSSQPPQEESERQTAHHSLLNDGGLLGSLPYALRSALMMGQRPDAADNGPSLATAAMKGPKSADSGASIASAAETGAVGRLVGERAFHFSASAANLTTQADLKGESALAAGFPQAEAMPAKPFADAVPSGGNALLAAPIAPRAGAPPTDRVSHARATAHNAARSERKPEVSAALPAGRVATSAAVVAPKESSGRAADSRLPDSDTPAAPSAPQTDLFGAQLSAPFVVGGPFGADASTARGAHSDIAPRANALAAGPLHSASPVREIDVDLSPGGIEDVSMTMRLAGDKLSVVIRAASSQTLGSIEGARDAIADRMAAIGQPLDSLIVKQAGANTDGNANGNGSSADGGSAGSEQRSAQGGGSNDALSRRGADRDRSF